MTQTQEHGLWNQVDSSSCWGTGPCEQGALEQMFVICGVFESMGWHFFFCERLDSKYFRVCGPDSLCHICSTLPL